MIIAWLLVGTFGIMGAVGALYGLYLEWREL